MHKKHWFEQNAFLTAQSSFAKQVVNILLSLQVDLWVFAQHTGVQWPKFSPLQYCSGQNALLTALCCSAKQADSMLVSLQLHLWTVLQHTGVQCLITHCTAALVRANCVPHCPELLCKLAALVWTTWIPHCLVLQSLITTALLQWLGQNAFLTAQSCSAKQADSRLVSLQIHLWVLALDTSVHCLITTALQHWSEQNAFLTAQSCSAKQADRRLVSLQIDIWVFAEHTCV